MKTYHTVLTIAGSDSGGGAGIQADLKTMTSLKCYGLSVITSLTAQNTQGVQGIHPVPEDFILRQLSSVFEDIEIQAVKIGMLHSKEVANAVGSFLKDYEGIPVVLDPVMVATSGDLLLEKDAVEEITQKVFPIAELITPNIHEAKVLSNMDLSTTEELKEGCRKLHALGAKNVLIKGGDIDSPQARDLLFISEKEQFIELSCEKIRTQNLHGTGCSLSSAIASFLAKGIGIEDSVKKAKNYISQAIRLGSEYKLGKGNGPVNHMWQL